MKRSFKEFLVGSLLILGVVLILAFGWLLGMIGPLKKEVKFQVLYSFAGGVEVGSPVRVSGVKVGKVDHIEFLPSGPERKEDPVNLRLTVSVSTTAHPSVREDSKFYVNMAGIIGERYVEISPGSQASPILTDGATVRGVDPPRVDQLLSQGYGVFGRIEELLNNNGQAVTDFLTQLDTLLKDANRFLKTSEKKRIFQLLDNMTELTGDMREITRGMKDPESKEIYRMLFDLVRRAHEVDRPALKKFLQEEGIRARIF